MTATLTAVSQTQSLAAIRNFVRASVSCITYARGLCGDASFEQRPFLGFQLRHMIPNTPEAVTLSEWVEKGAFDALNRGFLREMALCVYNPSCTELLESYCFGFAYSADGQRANLSVDAAVFPHAYGAASPAPCLPAPQLQQLAATAGGARSSGRRRTKQEVQRLLAAILTRLIEVVESLPPLLHERVLTMRLSYYEDVVPAEYEPPCFAPATAHMVQLYHKEVDFSVSLGSADTGHHVFTVAVRHPLLAAVHARLEATPKQQQRQRPSPAALDGISDAAYASLQDTTAPYTFTSSSCLPQAGQCAGEMSGRGQRRLPPGECDLTDASQPSCHTVLRPCHVEALPPLSELLHRSSTAPAPALPWPTVAFLLLVAYVFTRAPAAPSGAGRVRAAELQRFLSEVSAVAVSQAAARCAMRRLVTDGLLSSNDAGTVDATDSAAAVRADASRVQAACDVQQRAPDTSCTAGKEGVSEWVFLADPPLPLVQALLAQPQLVQLLAPLHRAALQALVTALQARQTRKPRVARKRRRPLVS